MAVFFSLGGAIAIRIAASGEAPNLQGLVVLDVVEGAAMEALPTMRSFIEKFPRSFKSIEDAVEWSLKNGEGETLLGCAGT